jgi:CDP-glycerol glycerophosphotransferase
VQRARRRLLRLIRPLWELWSAEVRALWRRSPVRPRTVLYESFAGNGALCNPEAIFRELLGSADMGDLRHVWVLKDLRRHRVFRSEFARHPGVRFVRYKSVGYFRALATSGYLINNATFPPEFSKREGQVYLNTWHGTPLKRMGYDMPGGALESANTLRNFVSADFLLSQNSFMTHQMYETAYRLRGAFRGIVIEEGYPRVDRQFLDEPGRRAARAGLEAAGIPLRGREIVLYAPTWKGESFSSPTDDARELIETTRELQRLLGEDRYVVLLKSHQVVHRLVAAESDYRAVLVPNEIPTNVVLGLSSILITDYSSIFFDFLATRRPIIFYRPDANDYASSRGTYFGPEQLPGPVCGDVAQAAEEIRAFADGETSAAASEPRYADWRSRFVGSDDGTASRRVVDVVFRGQANARRTVSIAEEPRAALLLHLGSMNSNGITTSALNLLGAIDHDVFDVSVVFTRPSSGQQRSNQLRIDPRVRQFHRAGGMNGSILTHLRRRLAEWSGRRDVHRSSPGQRRMWDDEWSRCFGRARFERIVDFDGYGPFWATLLLHGPASSHSIWLHNDMAAERHRIIRGRERIRRSLGAVFALYHEFDALVSVSPSLSEINRRGLGADYDVDPGAFLSARNLVDESHVLDSVGVPLAEIVGSSGDTATALVGMPSWAVEISADNETKWFITVGRFSTEKNQSRLVRAFGQVHRLRPESRLLVVGYGPLEGELAALIRQLGLTGSAFVVGPYANPFPILAAADCFVLSSNYEGQPMVILEAAIVGLPIVSVDFGSIRDALPDSTIHIVAQDDDSLAEGMLAFLRGEVPPQRLDVEAYNRVTTGEFVTAITTSRPRSNPTSA